jgi:FlaA1/EpsC-like NDP-sugar epimerase
MIKPSKLFTIGYMPRWFILCMDVALSFFSILLSILLRFNFETALIEKSNFIRTILVTLSAYLLFFFIFKPYKEIIRHTTFHGVRKVLLAVLCANVLLLFVSFFFSRNTRIVSYSITMINFFISFFMLGGSRMAIKKLFETALTIKKDVAVIFGAGKMGLAALKTIHEDKLSDWRVIAFIDDDITKQKKVISGIKVYDIHGFAKNIKKWSVKRAIIAVNSISLKRRNEVADFFIQHGVKVSILPYNQQWLHDPFKIRRLRDIKIEDLLEREPIQINSQAISTTINNKSILITGAAGSIGSQIVKQVAAFQPKLILLCDMAESPLHDIGLFMEENFPAINYKLLIGSITDFNCMDKVFAE